jgi:hypothetical protein
MSAVLKSVAVVVLSAAALWAIWPPQLSVAITAIAQARPCDTAAANPPVLVLSAADLKGVGQ